MELFKQLGLPPEIVAAVAEKGYVKPTPIQEKAIPEILAGRDIIGSAQTGTGKTAAFALPVLAKLEATGKTSCLVLVPTRELASQVEENFIKYGQHKALRIALLYGGVGYGEQRAKLKAGVDVVVATPGRLLDLLGQKALSLSGVRFLILDEVDRMLDMGFIDDVRRIISYCPKQRQTLLFSATVPDAIQRLAEWALRDPVQVNIGGRRSPAETVDHAVYPVDAIQKHDLLVALLESLNYESVLIFTRTKRDADRIAEWLQKHDHEVAVMHADRSQSEREEALNGFKSGRFKLLVATDVASRGLDISNITHVINYNVPQHAEDYVHRIGRTGRAAREGEAFTLYSNDEHAFLKAVEAYIEMEIPRRQLEGFAYMHAPDMGAQGVQKPKRRNMSQGRGLSHSRVDSRFGFK